MARKHLGSACMAALALFTAASATATEYYPVRLTTVPGQTKDYEPHTLELHQTYFHSIGSADNQNTYPHVPIRLDVGSVIPLVTCYGDDNATANATFTLRRSTFDGETPSTIATFSSTNSTGTWASSSLSHTVATDYIYWLDLEIPGNIDFRVRTCEVAFTP